MRNDYELYEEIISKVIQSIGKVPVDKEGMCAVYNRYRKVKQPLYDLLGGDHIEVKHSAEHTGWELLPIIEDFYTRWEARFPNTVAAIRQAFTDSYTDILSYELIDKFPENLRNCLREYRRRPDFCCLLAGKVPTKDGLTSVPKFLNKAIESKPDYFDSFLNDYTTRYLPYIKPKEFTYQISARMSDFLLMSQHGVTSCVRICGRNDGDEDVDFGEYCGGVSSLAFDPNTLIATVTTGDKTLPFGSYELTAPYKVWRALIYLNPSRTAFEVSRQYPDSNEIHHKRIRSLLEERIATFLEVPNKWVKTIRNSRFDVRVGGPMYGGDSPSAHVIHKDTYLKLLENPVEVPRYWANTEMCVFIGDDEYMCLHCGDIIYAGDDENIYLCSDCAGAHGKYQCAECGTVISEDEVYYVGPNQEITLCHQCFDTHTFRCAHCGDYFWVGISESYSAHGREVCEGCASELYKCDDCGEVILYHDTPYTIHRDGYEYIVCEDCVTNYDQCEKCDKVGDDIHLYYIDGVPTYLCDDCYAEVQEEQEEKEEVV